MKANEFVKTHGIKSAQDIVKHYGNHTHITDDARMFITDEFYKKTSADYVDDLNSMVGMVDLKRLVDSHELVGSYKGCGKPRETALATAKFTLRHLKSTRKLEMELFGSNNRELELERAIADVESCK